MAAAATPRGVLALASVLGLVAVLALAADLPAPSTTVTKEKQKQFKVGGPNGWCLPPPEVKEDYYVNWSLGINFYVGDSLGTCAAVSIRSLFIPSFSWIDRACCLIHLRARRSAEFVFKNDSVIQVDKAGYYHCTWPPPPDDAAPHDGKMIFLLDAPGYVYFASADQDRCMMGERLMVNVLGPGETAAAPAPAPAVSSAAVPPSVHAMAMAAMPVALAGGLI